MKNRAIALAACLLFTGCEGSSLLKDVKEKSYWKQGRRDQGYLGVMVARGPSPDAQGLRVVRVLKWSPAAKVGLREGDFLLEVYGNPFETPPAEVKPADTKPREPEAPASPPGVRLESSADLDAALLKAGAEARVTLVVARGNQVMTLPVTLDDTTTCWNEQRRNALASAEESKATIDLPLLLSYERQSIEPDAWKSSFGTTVREPVRRYLNVDVAPVLFLSLFRYESVPAADAWRLKILCWPFVFTSFGDHNASADGIVQPGQESLVEL